MVEVGSDYNDQSYIFSNKNDVFGEMFEEPSWYDAGESNWCEFMMWDRDEDSDYPKALARKYNLS